MSRLLLMLVVAAFVLVAGTSDANAAKGPLFGFGYQWFRDADGDGIPNHLDDDWVRPENGTGYQLKHGNFGPNTAGDKNQYNHQKRFQYRPKGPGPNGDTHRDGDGGGDSIRRRLRDGSCQ